MADTTLATTTTSYRVASASGAVLARVIDPANRSGLPPLMVLHGISRNADDLVALFRPEAERTGRKIVVPHFTREVWPHFQRPAKAALPDQALLALLAHLALIDPSFAGPINLFGHSGGAQLAHRFAMLYPNRLGRLHLAAAGWYCLPDTSMAYPYGLGADETPGSLTWARRHQDGLASYLRLPVSVYVGTRDTRHDAALRQTEALDRQQGTTRLARAETYVERFRAAARTRGIHPDITLTRLAGVSHDVVQAIQSADLAHLVTKAGPTPLRAVS